MLNVESSVVVIILYNNVSSSARSKRGSPIVFIGQICPVIIGRKLMKTPKVSSSPPPSSSQRSLPPRVISYHLLGAAFREGHAKAKVTATDIDRTSWIGFTPSLNPMTSLSIFAIWTRRWSSGAVCVWGSVEILGGSWKDTKIH